MTDDLVAWLRAQLDEDPGEVHDLDCNLSLSVGFHGPCDCGWPARMLREVEAKRRILDQIVGEIEDLATWAEAGPSGTSHSLVKLIALPYADRPGYREEWKP